MQQKGIPGDNWWENKHINISHSSITGKIRLADHRQLRTLDPNGDIDSNLIWNSQALALGRILNLKTILSKMVTTDQMWLVTFKMIKIKSKNSVTQSHWLHFKCSAATSGRAALDPQPVDATPRGSPQSSRGQRGQTASYPPGNVSSQNSLPTSSFSALLLISHSLFFLNY